jgi:hypothetical protein
MSKILSGKKKEEGKKDKRKERPSSRNGVVR